MVKLDMFSNVAKQLAKARGLTIESTAIFRRLLIVILMEDFYQFPLVIGYLLWDEVYIEEDHYGKMLWRSFNAVITLTQQMRQIDDPKFNTLLRRAHASFLTNANIINLNSKMAVDFPLHDLLKNTVIVQRNKTRHMINRLQAEQFARGTGRDFIIFLAQHSHNRKNPGDPIIYHDVVKIQDREHGTIDLGLLYYCKAMPVIILINVCTPLGIMNGATAIAYGIISHPNVMLTHIKIQLITNLSSQI